MTALPWDCLGLVLPFADNATLRSLSLTCKQIEIMTRQQVQTVRLAERGALWSARLWSAVRSGRFGAAFHMCQTLEVAIHNPDEDVDHLQAVLAIASRCAATCARRASCSLSVCCPCMHVYVECPNRCRAPANTAISSTAAAGNGLC